MLFDSHAHLDDERFDADRDAVIGAMQEAGVGLIMNVGADMPSSRRSVALAKKYPFIYAAVGVHPHDTEQMTLEDLRELREWAEEEKVRAVGEIGLDYHYDNSPRDKQKYWFEKQIELAQEVSLPIIIHCRDAMQDCMEILRKYDFSETSGVMHCYAGSAETAEEIVKMGLYVAFGGAITFKNNKKACRVVQSIPQERLLLETDCPYMTPEPHRGKRNDSRYLCHVAQKMGEFRGVAAEETERFTWENAKRLFRIEK